MAGLPVSQNPASQSKTQPKIETVDSNGGSAGLIAVIVIIIAVVGILLGLHRLGKQKHAEQQQQEEETKPSHEEKPDTNDDSNYKLGEFDG